MKTNKLCMTIQEIALRKIAREGCAYRAVKYIGGLVTTFSFATASRNGPL